MNLSRNSERFMMDRNLRASSNWDFTQLEQNMNTGGGSSSGGDFSVDLKLGQVVNGGNENGEKWKEGGVGKSSKRARGGSSGNQPTTCLVDGCASDLSNCRDYHRRHKVCELHSKSPQVSIGGEKQRFCQQCSRFHRLEEFDEGKRSCRKRLDGHNRRRRKPQPETTAPGSANILTNYQGSQLLSFSSSHMHHSSSMAIHNWANPDYLLHNQHQQLDFLPKNSFLGSHSYLNEPNQGKLLAFQAPTCQSLLHNVARTNIHDRFTTAVRESDCALSLLSSPHTQTSRSSISISARSEPMDSVLVSGISNGGLDCHGRLFHPGSYGEGIEPPPTLPFHWD